MVLTKLQSSTPRHTSPGVLSVSSGRMVPLMPLPVTIQQFIQDLDQAKALLQRAMNEQDPGARASLAAMAQASAEIANAEANWLNYTTKST